MQRILGQDVSGVWHIAASTYSTTIKTRCGKWLRVAAFAVEGKAVDPSAEAPRCAVCAHVARVYQTNPR